MDFTDPQNNYSSSSLSSSIVMIHGMSLPVGGSNFDSTTLSCAPQSSIFNDEELGAQLEELAKENRDLKEKLQEKNNLMNEELKKVSSLQQSLEDLKGKHKSELAQAKEHNITLECKTRQLSEMLEALQSSAKVKHSDSGTQMSILYDLENEISRKTSVIKELNAKLSKQEELYKEFINSVKEMRTQNGAHLGEMYSNNFSSVESNYESHGSSDFSNDNDDYAAVLQFIRCLIQSLTRKQESVQVLKNKVTKNEYLKLQLDEMIKIFSALIVPSNESDIDVDSDDCVKKLEDLQQSEFKNFVTFLLDVKKFNKEYTLVSLCNKSYCDDLLDAFGKVNLLSEEIKRLKQELCDQVQLKKQHEEKSSLISTSWVQTEDIFTVDSEVQCEEISTESTAAQCEEISTESTAAQCEEISTESTAAQCEEISTESTAAQCEELTDDSSTVEGYRQQIQSLEAKLLRTVEELDSALHEVSKFHCKLESLEKNTRPLHIQKAMLYKSAYEIEKEAHKTADVVVHELSAVVSDLEDKLVLSHTDVPQMKCPYCMQTFTTMNSFETHLRQCSDGQM